MGEYIPLSENRLSWLTGFTGSAGAVVVTANEAAFFTDGRYTLQASQEIDKDFVVINSAETLPAHWLKQKSPTCRLGFDPKLMTIGQKKQFTAILGDQVEWVTLIPNPIDAMWKDRPTTPATPITHHPVQFTGRTVSEKVSFIRKELEKHHADSLLITANDSLCWLMNIRAGDIPHTPFARCYGILTPAELFLFADKRRVQPEVLTQDVAITVCDPNDLPARLKQMKGHILLDPSLASVWIEEQCMNAGLKPVLKPDPCQLAKAIKHPVEQDGIRKAHRIDGLALTRFLYFLSTTQEALDEIRVCEVLESFRKQSPDYLEPSFPTICGSGPNGAIVHYRVSNISNRPLDKNSLLLVDSGGQYPFGTTDVTRTLALGNPTQEMRENYTRVLKGHIALATALFPEGTNGMQLDALARQYLWQAGLDYDHGTGHGVGCYLSVHEGPQRISKKSSDVALQPGMILSNEPGYYKDGEYGIRIENLVMVVEKPSSNGKRFLGFETLTLAPLDPALVDRNMLSNAERKWLKDYHETVYSTHHAALSDSEKEWLKHSVTVFSDL